jgi:hypothetical protein
MSDIQSRTLCPFFFFFFFFFFSYVFTFFFLKTHNFYYSHHHHLPKSRSHAPPPLKSRSRRDDARAGGGLISPRGDGNNTPSPQFPHDADWLDAFSESFSESSLSDRDDGGGGALVVVPTGPSGGRAALRAPATLGHRGDAGPLLLRPWAEDDESCTSRSVLDDGGPRRDRGGWRAVPVARIILDEFQGAMEALGDECAAQGSRLASEDMFLAMALVERYGSLLAELKADPTVGHAIVVSHCEQIFDLAMFKEVYVDRSMSLMEQWCDRIAAGEGESPVLTDAEGRFYTAGHIDVFRIVNDQITGLSQASVDGDTSTGDVARRLLTRALADNGARMILRYQERHVQAIEGGWTAFELDRLCAQCNNALESVEFVDEYLENLAEDPHAGISADGDDDVSLALDDARAAFQSTMRVASSILVDHMFIDLRRPIRELMTWSWADGNGSQVASIAATVCDYLDDIGAVVHPTPYRRVLVECVERVVFVYLDALLYRCDVPLDESLAELVFDDIEAIEAKFAAHVKPGLLSMQLKVLRLVQDVIGTAPEEAIDAFLDVKAAHPDATAAEFEALLRARDDMDDAEVASCLSRYRRGNHDATAAADTDADLSDVAAAGAAKGMQQIFALLRAYQDSGAGVASTITARVGDFLRDSLGVSLFAEVDASDAHHRRVGSGNR